MAKQEAQSKAGKGAKRKGESAVGPQAKKAHTPSAALGRAPPEPETETLADIQVTVSEGAGLMATLGASSLEDYLTGKDIQTTETMSAAEQRPQPGKGTDTAVTGMGGFLKDLKGMIPKAKPKRTPVQTPIPRRPGGKWIPVLGKPAPSKATVASLLVPQPGTGGAAEEPSQAQHPPERTAACNPDRRDHSQRQQPL